MDKIDSSELLTLEELLLLNQMADEKQILKNAEEQQIKSREKIVDYEKQMAELKTIRLTGLIVGLISLMIIDRFKRGDSTED